MRNSSIQPAIARRSARRSSLLVLAACAVCILGCGRHSGESMPPATEEIWYFAVEGMSCEGCVGSVTAAIQPLPGVESVEVSLKDKKATVRVNAAQASPQAIEEAVQKAGYKATQQR